MQPDPACTAAFKLKSDLTATWAKPIDAAAAWAAVEECYLAMEVCGSRFLPPAFAEATPYQKVADGGMNVALILGPTFSPAELIAKDLAGTKSALIVNGTEKGAGTGFDVLEDPINSIAWLANSLGRYGKGLKAGMIVTTGACAVIQPGAYSEGDTVVAAFEGLGEVTLSLAPPAAKL